MGDPERSAGDSGHVASVRSAARVLKLVDWLAVRQGPVSLAEASVLLDLPKSSVRLLLKTLVEGGYAAQDEKGGYRMIRLPGDVPGDPQWSLILRIADPIVREAVPKVRESGFIAVMTNNRIRYLTKVLPPDREIFYDRNIELERIPHHVASGLAILSMLPEDLLDAYFQHGEDACLREEKAEADLRRRLAKIRADGFAVNLKGRIEGAGGVAAPVFDQNGLVIAAINISGPTERVKSNLDEITRAVVEGARQATRSVAALRCFPLRELAISDPRQ